MKKIIVTTLTTGTRNTTFDECLLSLQALTNINGYKIDILVVENNQRPDEQVQTIISGYNTSEKSVKYLLEPIKGIPHARNAALNFAKQEGYSYLAFIDDDAFVGIESK